MSSSTSTVRHFTMSKSLNESLAEPGKPKHASEKGRSIDQAKKTEENYSKSEKDPLGSDKPNVKQGITFAAQEKLPKLPIPELDLTIKRYLRALKPLQGDREHAETQQAAEEFLKGEGVELQEKLKKYATGKTSYIEQFCKSVVEWGSSSLTICQGMTLT